MTDAAVALAGLAVASGDQETALRLTASVLEANPNSVPASATRAQSFLAKGDVKQAETLLLDALKREPASFPLLNLLLNIRISQGKSHEMVQRIAPLVEQQPQNAGLRFVFALANYAAGDIPKSETNVREALKLDAKTRSGHLLLAYVLLAKKETEPAKAELRSAIEVEPRNLSGYLLLGSLYETEKNWEEAKKVYEKARQVDPESPLIANQLAYLYLEHGGDTTAALALAQQAKAKLPQSPNIADTLGWAYYKRGMNDLATTQFKQAAQIAPKNPTYHYHLGLAYLAARNMRATEESLQLALKDPNFQYAEPAREALKKTSKGAR
jgi:tetratricopeptide (TPR) repeat protein